MRRATCGARTTKRDAEPPLGVGQSIPPTAFPSVRNPNRRTPRSPRSTPHRPSEGALLRRPRARAVRTSRCWTCRRLLSGGARLSVRADGTKVADGRGLDAMHPSNMAIIVRYTDTADVIAGGEPCGREGLPVTLPCAAAANRLPSCRRWGAASVLDLAPIQESQVDSEHRLQVDVSHGVPPWTSSAVGPMVLQRFAHDSAARSTPRRTMCGVSADS
jgi:hypothetical protein